MSIDAGRTAARSDSTTEPTQLYLRFQIGEVIYAIRDAGVHNVIPVEVEPVPEKIAKNGVLYPIVDPRSLFRLADKAKTPLTAAGPIQARVNTEESRLILLSAGNRLSALLVDRVFDRLRIDARRFQAIPWHFGGREQLWFEGVACLDEHRCLVLLRPQGLLASSNPSPATRSIPRTDGP